MSGESIDYAAALRECGFDEGAVTRGLRMLEGQEPGSDFGNVVSMLRIQGHPVGVREHHLEPILRRLAAAEVRAAITARGERSRLHVASVNADREAREARRQRVARERNRAMSWLLENMNDDEFEARTGFRPHIAEGWRHALLLKAEEQQLNGERVSPHVEEQLRALDAASRLSLISASPSPASAPITRSADGSATFTRELSDGRKERTTYVPVREAGQASDLVETFRAFGLSEDVAQQAANGR